MILVIYLATWLLYLIFFVPLYCFHTCLQGFAIIIIKINNIYGLCKQLRQKHIHRQMHAYKVWSMLYSMFLIDQRCLDLQNKVEFLNQAFAEIVLRKVCVCVCVCVCMYICLSFRTHVGKPFTWSLKAACIQIIKAKQSLYQVTLMHS